MTDAYVGKGGYLRPQIPMIAFGFMHPTNYLSLEGISIAIN